MKTPCYIIDEKELDASFSGFKSALARHFDHYIPSYSVKTNSLPYVLKKASLFGYFAEVVSDDEYRLALQCGFSRDRMIFNGPQKTKETFIEALLGGAMINIETFREIEWLENTQLSNEFHVGIRMNINISQVSKADENHESDDSRFGFSCESGDFQRAVERITQIPNITLDRVHLHRTSRTRSVEFYCNLIDYAMQQIAQNNISISQIDLGGGYFGIMPGKPTYEDYASAISRTLKKHLDISQTTVIFEPGNAIVASSFDFLSSVIDVKHHDKAYFVTIDGSRIDIDPFFRKSSYFHEIQYMDQDSRDIVATQIVGGCTCLEYDRLMELNNNQLLRVGDMIRFHRVGAYTMTLTPLFIRYWPEVYVDNGNSLQLVRNKFPVKLINVLENS